MASNRYSSCDGDITSADGTYCWHYITLTGTVDDGEYFEWLLADTDNETVITGTSCEDHYFKSGHLIWVCTDVYFGYVSGIYDCAEDPGVDETMTNAEIKALMQTDVSAYCDIEYQNESSAYVDITDPIDESSFIYSTAANTETPTASDIDWTAGMQREYELVEMDADTWTEGRAIDTLEECSITRENEGLRVSMTATVGEQLSEIYYRLYMVATQADTVVRVPLATVLCTDCSRTLNGKRSSYAASFYSALNELDVNYAPPGWCCEGSVTEAAKSIINNYCRAPLSYMSSTVTTTAWAAETGETWLDIVESLLALASMHIEVDAYGCIAFANDVSASECNPAYTFGTDDDRSILLPDLTEETDRADVPNRVEVIFSTDEASYYACAEDDDANRDTSTVNRGYTVTYQDTDPDLADTATADDVQAYADSLLASLVCQTKTITCEHGFVPDLDVGMCVGIDYEHLDYSARGIITKQVISCTPDCPVQETAEYEAD